MPDAHRRPTILVSTRSTLLVFAFDHDHTLYLDIRHPLHRISHSNISFYHRLLVRQSVGERQKRSEDCIVLLPVVQWFLSFMWYRWLEFVVSLSVSRRALHRVTPRSFPKDFARKVRGLSHLQPEVRSSIR